MTNQAERKPRLGVAVLVTHNKKLLLGKRGKQPNYGTWVIPGVGVNFGESWQKADSLRSGHSQQS